MAKNGAPTREELLERVQAARAPAPLAGRHPDADPGAPGPPGGGARPERRALRDAARARGVARPLRGALRLRADRAREPRRERDLLVGQPRRRAPARRRSAQRAHRHADPALRRGARPAAPPRLPRPLPARSACRRGAIELELSGAAGRGASRSRSRASASSLRAGARADLLRLRSSTCASGAAPRRRSLRAMFERDRLASQEAAARLASEAKDRFLAVLSHELRTPLTPILLTLERLERESNATRGAPRPALDTIRRNLSVETRLIDDLLDITRIERDRLTLAEEIVDLHAALRHAVDMCADDFARAGLRLSVELGASNRLGARRRDAAAPGVLEPPDQRACATPRRAARCACRPTTGTARLRRRHRHRARRRARGSRARLRAVRAGRPRSARRRPRPGPRHLPRPRARARRNDPRREHRQGPGTTFTVELPDLSPRPRGSKAVPAHASPAGAGQRVLLVEDNEDTAVALAMLLRAHGYEVELAHTHRRGARSAARPLRRPALGPPAPRRKRARPGARGRRGRGASHGGHRDERVRHGARHAARAATPASRSTS